MARRLCVASGGSGDLIAAWALSQLPSLDRTIAFAAPIWERSILDPHPGPRGPEDLSGLGPDPRGWLISPATSLPGGWSPLPKFVEVSGAEVFFLDVTVGVEELGRQLSTLCDHAQIDLIELVDVGGDVLATGDESGLRSPALDALLLAACDVSGLKAVVTVVGAGLDGELSLRELRQAHSELPLINERVIPRSVASRTYGDLAWFPSEASLMMLLGSQGLIATVDIKAGLAPVVLDRGAAIARTYPLEDVVRRSRLAQAVRHAASFDEVGAALSRAGQISEIASERMFVKRDATPPTVAEVSAMLAQLDNRVTHTSLRRCASIYGASNRAHIDALDAKIRRNFAAAYHKPLVPTFLLQEYGVELHADLGLDEGPTSSMEAAQ
ncbi:DUF1152 domain-containing protein [Nonomuraea sp. SMC257]|uniref:DUF1152 domain-containing protein n=1 Tax=Nonomuraea montanisoli TaxID=2741721 RepID=A0A7Y6I2J7_9ACTN|nr:DUF1152 domain-containing protein [Nonomuraea montanisoli]NUW30540.1 DUF1152 domain-containing protein [Nonomuraea montanisoli]